MWFAFVHVIFLLDSAFPENKIIKLTQVSWVLCSLRFRNSSENQLPYSALRCFQFSRIDSQGFGDMVQYFLSSVPCLGISFPCWFDNKWIGERLEEMDKLVLKFVWVARDYKIAKTSWTKQKLEDSHLDCKAYHKASIIKTAVLA